MIADLVATMAERNGFSVNVRPGPSGVIVIETTDTATLVGVMLRRQRERHGLSGAKRLELRSKAA